MTFEELIKELDKITKKYSVRYDNHKSKYNYGSPVQIEIVALGIYSGKYDSFKGALNALKYKIHIKKCEGKIN